MSRTGQEVSEMKNLDDVEDAIRRAQSKLGLNKESQLCRFLPSPNGGKGYLHHFTFKKWKSRNPKELRQVIENHILGPERPQLIPHKERAPRGNLARLLGKLSPKDLDQLMVLVQQSGSPSLTAVFSPKHSLADIKRMLIYSIRINEVNRKLWDAYVEVVGKYIVDQAADFC